MDLVDLLSVATKGQLFQFDRALYEQTDGIAMGSPLRPLVANVLCHPSKIPLSDKENFHPFTIDMLTTHSL